MKKRLNVIKPNLGNDRAYLKELRSILLRMKKEVNEAKTDDLTQFGNRIDYLLEQWDKRLDRLAYSISKRFINKQRDTFDRRFMQELRKAGFTVQFQLSPNIEKVLEASINENVGLIKSIGSGYLERVQQQVWSGIASGYDLGQITKELKECYGISDRRAKNIARDQGSKAHAIIERERRKEAGITEAIWLHSHAGKVPRQSHVAANGKRFNIEKGLFLDNVWVLPGQAINCLPGESVIKSFNTCKKLWRRWYDGELTKIVTSSGKSINATPNHPVLTQRGWVAIKDINIGDYVINRFNESIDATKENIDGSEPTFREIFDATSFLIGNHRSRGTAFQFHGDISDSYVDVIDTAGFLPSVINTSFIKCIFELFFSKADHIIVGLEFNSFGSLFSAFNGLLSAPECVIRRFCSIFSLLRSHSSHANDICFRLTSYLNSAINESIPDSASSDIESFRQLKLAQSGFIQGDDLIIRELFEILNSSWNNETPSSEVLPECFSMDVENGSSLLCAKTLTGYQLDSVVDKTFFRFVNHVYNLENSVNWYLSGNIITHNCRCGSMAVIDI